MEAFTLLGATKLLIDFFEGNYSGVATGIIISSIPGSELYDIAETVYDLNGNFLGTREKGSLEYVPITNLKLNNEDFVKSQLPKLNLTTLEKKSISKSELTKYQKPDLGKFDMNKKKK